VVASPDPLFLMGYIFTAVISPAYGGSFYA
jgi:hypothetical protein